MKLQAPDNCQSASVSGQTYLVDEDGTLEVELAEHAVILRSHGFTDWVEPLPAPSDDPRMPEQPVSDAFDGMNRQGLFAWARAHGLKLKTPITLDQQRALCRAHLASGALLIDEPNSSPEEVAKARAEFLAARSPAEIPAPAPEAPAEPASALEAISATTLAETPAEPPAAPSVEAPEAVAPVTLDAPADDASA